MASKGWRDEQRSTGKKTQREAQAIRGREHDPKVAKFVPRVGRGNSGIGGSVGVQIGERSGQFSDRVLCPPERSRWAGDKEAERTPGKIAEGYLSRLQRDIGEAETRLIKAKQRVEAMENEISILKMEMADLLEAMHG